MVVTACAGGRDRRVNPLDCRSIDQTAFVLDRLGNLKQRAWLSIFFGFAAIDLLHERLAQVVTHRPDHALASFSQPGGAFLAVATQEVFAKHPPREIEGVFALDLADQFDRRDITLGVETPQFGEVLHDVFARLDRRMIKPLLAVLLDRVVEITRPPIVGRPGFRRVIAVPAQHRRDVIPTDAGAFFRAVVLGRTDAEAGVGVGPVENLHFTLGRAVLGLRTFEQFAVLAIATAIAFRTDGDLHHAVENLCHLGQDWLGFFLLWLVIAISERHSLRWKVSRIEYRFLFLWRCRFEFGLDTAFTALLDHVCIEGAGLVFRRDRSRRTNLGLSLYLFAARLDFLKPLVQSSDKASLHCCAGDRGD